MLAHPTDAQCSHLSPSSESLQTDGYFPTFFAREDKNVSLALLIADIGSQHMESL